VSIILFLNKTDLLQRKLASPDVDIKKHFPEYKGDPKNLSQVQNFILNLFKSTKRSPTRDFFYHFTTAVDTEDIKYVFNAVKATVLDRNIKDLMLE